MSIPSKQYAIGYGRPPEHSKWKKGQCGNPAQIRKRTVKPVSLMIDEFFASERTVIENGVSRRRSAFEIIYLQLYNKAMAGNTRALNALKEYSDFAASRNPACAMKLELIDDEASPKESGRGN